MPVKPNIQIIEIDDTGGTYSISNDYTTPVDFYLVRIASGDTGTLSGSVTISATNTEEGVTYTFILEDAFTIGANTFTVMGASIGGTQAASKPMIIARDEGASYGVNIIPNFLATFSSVNTQQIADEAVTLAKMADLARGAMYVGDPSNRPSAIDVAGAGRFPLGDGTDVNAVSMSGDATMNGSGVITISNSAITFAKMQAIAEGNIIIGNASNVGSLLDISGNAEIPIGNGTTATMNALSGDVTMTNSGVVTIGNDKITTAKILDGNVTVEKVETGLKTEVITVPVSFESGEQCDNRVKIPYDCTVDEIYAVVTKAIAGTDDATITPKDGSGTNMTAGAITFTASDPLETAATATPTANNTVSAGDIIYLTTAKVTAGGKALVSLKVTKT